MISVYLTIVIVSLMIAYAGFEGTMRVFAYLDLQMKFIPIKIKMNYMKWNMKRQLDKDRNYILKELEKNAKDS
jgi:hypothetical protein